MIYAIGDIHGHLDKLRDTHALIAEDKAKMGAAEAPIVHIGDLIDRGPDSAGVIDYLMRGTHAGQPWINLMGNHDRLMLWYMEDPRRKDPGLRSEYHWLHERIGGLDTLASYGVSLKGRTKAIHQTARNTIPEAHVDFLAKLRLSYQHDGVFFVHAGIRPGVALADQSVDDLLWIRKEFHDDPRDHGALIVHGHTPVSEVSHYGNRVNIDTGAAFGRDLSAVAIEGRDVFLLTREGREPIAPNPAEGDYA